MKGYILFVIIILVQLNCTSQQTVDNDKAHRRYWYYRTRMINDFMKIGKEQGACIVFAERNNGQDNLLLPVVNSKIGPDQIDITNQYIMALALEYKILSRNNQDTRETVKEIYHMLYAINRLDLEAEVMMNPATWQGSDVIQSNGILNGYILREDMPKQFMIDNFLHYNYSIEERPSTNTDPLINYGGYTGAQHTNTLSADNKFSDFFPSNHGGTGKEPFTDLTLVQDKYMSMLAALMFVKKYIPDSETYNGEVFQDNETSIKQEASNIAGRCYTYLKGTTGNWTLKYLNQNGTPTFALTAGSTAYLYSWPLSRMACWANSSFPWNQNSPVQCTNYNDNEATTNGRAVYNTFTQGTYTCAEDNAVFKAWCQAGSNSPSFNNLGFLAPICIGMGPNAAYNGIEWAELLRKVLHQDGALLKQLSVYGDAINVAPCQGPYNYGNCIYGGFEWSSQDRLEHPSARGDGCNINVPRHPVPCINYNKPVGFPANYPGVDYMLLHNLYYEYQNQVLDGNNGNNVNDPIANVITTIYNSANTVGSTVSSAACSVVNAISGFFGGSTSLCDPTNVSDNGGSGSNNVSLPGYRGAYNYMDNMDENIWPRFIVTGLPIQGTASTPGKVAVFQNLSSIAHIYASSSPAAPNNTIPADVTYRAGKEIDLQPGFTVDAGSTFHAYIQRYLCNGNNSNPLYMRHSAAGSSGTISDSLLRLELLALDYESDLINPIPIHYIVSPTSDSDNNPTVPDTYMEDEDLTGYAKLNDFDVTPNPSSGLLKIKTRKMHDDEVLSAHVYDMKGQLIISYYNISDEKEINLQGYSTGIYMIQVMSNTGRSMTKKIDITD